MLPEDQLLGQALKKKVINFSGKHTLVYYSGISKVTVLDFESYQLMFQGRNTAFEVSRGDYTITSTFVLETVPQ